jgi:hypothetical protein
MSVPVYYDSDGILLRVKAVNFDQALPAALPTGPTITAAFVTEHEHLRFAGAVEVHLVLYLRHGHFSIATLMPASFSS